MYENLCMGGPREAADGRVQTCVNYMRRNAKQWWDVDRSNRCLWFSVVQCGSAWFIVVHGDGTGGRCIRMALVGGNGNSSWVEPRYCHHASCCSTW